jgi:hypothetical protein
MGKTAEKQLQDTIKWHERATATAFNRPVLTYSYVDSSALVSADGFAMHVSFGDFSALPTVNGLFAHKHSIEDGAGKFPAWASLVPASYAYRASFTVGQMKLALKQVRIFAKDSNDSVRVIFQVPEVPYSGDVITLVGASSEHGDCACNVNADARATSALNPLVVAVGGAYLADALSGWADGDTIELRANASNSPVVVGTDQQFALIMPMNPLGGASVEEFTAKGLAFRHGGAESYPRPAARKHAKSASKFDREQAKERKERAAARLFVELPNGARIAADVEHDPQASPLHTMLSKARYHMFNHADCARVGIEIKPGALRIVTAHHDGARPELGHVNVLTLVERGGGTEYKIERRYTDPARSMLVMSDITGSLPFVVNRRSLGRALREYLPDGAEVIVKRPVAAPAVAAAASV